MEFLIGDPHDSKLFGFRQNPQYIVRKVGGPKIGAELMGSPFLRAQQMQNLVPLKGGR